MTSTITQCLAAFLLLSYTAVAQTTISTCPTTESTYVTSSGSLYAICPGTDYQGAIAATKSSVTSEAACADLCEKTTSCTKGVFDKISSTCWLKGSTATWVTSTQYSTLRYVSKLVQGSVITSCPYTESSYTSSNGVAYKVCPGTDYQSNTIKTIPLVLSNTACMNLCNQASGCAKAVFDKTLFFCHLKGDPSSFTWVVNKQYDAIRRATSSTTTTSKTTIPSTTSTTKASTALTTTSTTTSAITSATTSTTSSTTSTSSSIVTSAPSSISSSTTVTTSSSTTISTSSVTNSSTSNLSSTSTSPATNTSITSSSTTSTTAPTQTGSCVDTDSCVVDATILVIVKDAAAAKVATSGLNAYGIPFFVLQIPSTGTTLPALNSTTGGNFGGIVVASQVSYDYGASGYASALTTDQWNQLFAYQIAYGVRMIQYDVYPGAGYGTSPVGGCCGAGVEQTFSFTDVSDFAQAGLKTGAGLSTVGLYHYAANIINSTSTKEIAQFAPNSQIAQISTAAVINTFGRRQQMVFFMPMATDWSATSNLIQHAYITWLTRGLYAGIRRVNFNTQIDDVHLQSAMYYPANTTYRITPDDMNGIVSWIKTINAKMNTGSYYLPELGHNGNGNILAAQAIGVGADDVNPACDPGAVDPESGNATALEWIKPLGSGTDAWPDTPTVYPYKISCLNLDPLKRWFSVTANRDNFMHITHTFSHLSLNNATYSDALKEIQFNQAWLQMAGFSGGLFSADGLIPPAITGLHNGDVLRAWKDAGLTNAVGDNTRPVLRNQNNNMWPYITTVASNGFDGYTVIPRFATRIYYNCDTPICTLTEWINTSAGSGDFTTLLAAEKADVSRQLFGLMHDGYMFHQANLRNTGVSAITINGVSAQISIFQAWVETVVQEFTRLVNWPMITLRQTDLATSFLQRAARDACAYKLTWNMSKTNLLGVTVSCSNGNTCSSLIPLTVPGTVTNTQKFKTEKVGNDPLTIWVALTGAPITFTLTTPIALS